MIPTDLHNMVEFAVTEPIATITDNEPFVSTIIDMQGKTSLEFVLFVGALADADTTATVLVEHGEEDNLSDNAAVPDDELLGTEAGAAFQFDDDNTVTKIGYRGTKRYVRMTVTPAGNTGNFTFGALAMYVPTIRGTSN